jgi:hypothetical protein
LSLLALGERFCASHFITFGCVLQDKQPKLKKGAGGGGGGGARGGSRVCYQSLHTPRRPTWKRRQQLPLRATQPLGLLIMSRCRLPHCLPPEKSRQGEDQAMGLARLVMFWLLSWMVGLVVLLAVRRRQLHAGNDALQMLTSRCYPCGCFKQRVITIRIIYKAADFCRLIHSYRTATSITPCHCY